MKMAEGPSLAAFDPREDEWEEWLERFEFYLDARNVTDTEKQKSYLLSQCGKEAYSVLRSLVSPSKVKDKTYSEIVKLLNGHLKPKKSVTVARYQFNTCCRKEGQSVSDYVAELRKLTEHCAFGEALNEMLRDRLVCGVNNAQMQRKLLSEETLTFEQANRICLSLEAASRDARIIGGQESAVHEISVPDRYEQLDDVNEVSTGQRSRSKPCYRCGGLHAADTCRYATFKCHKCGKVGHLARRCAQNNKGRVWSQNRRGGTQPTRLVGRDPETTDQSESEFDSDPIHTVVNSVKGASGPVTVDVEVEGSVVRMEVDTGSAVSLVNETTFHRLHPTPKLSRSKSVLRTYTGAKIPVIGEFIADIKYNDQTRWLPLVVVGGGGPNLLGRDWLGNLRLDWFNIFSVSERYAVTELKETYAEVFKPELGELKGIKVKLDIDKNVSPKFYKPRPLPFLLKSKVDEQLKREIDMGVLEPVGHAVWGAPIVPVLKSDGSVRICGNFKLTANRAIRVDKYPLPRIEDIFSSLAGGQVFTKLDLSQAYQQCVVDEDCRDVLTINTHLGPLRYRRLAYGVNSAVSLFQREMERLMSGMSGVCVFLDDILITGKSRGDCLQRTSAVLKRLQEAGLRVSEKKCKFCVDSVEYLGHRIDAEGCHPTKAKVRAIQSVPTPQNVSELKTFLGILNYYARFIENRSDVLSPLHELLRKDVPWVWGLKEQNAFSEAKRLITSEKVLAHFTPELPLILTCDASSVGIGAVLSHRYGDGSEKPVGFVSRSLSKAEQKMSQVEREALALVFGVTKFHQYLFGNDKFVLVTDHKPLVKLFGEHEGIPVTASARLSRWALRLSAYNYTIQYKSTSKIEHADGLSRLPLPASRERDHEPAEMVFSLQSLEEEFAMDSDRIALLTSRDVLLSRVRQAMLTGMWSDEDDIRPFFHRRDELTEMRGVLLWGSRVVVPAKAQDHVLNELHEGHPGVSRMKAVARTCVWWAHLDRDIERFVRSCASCQQTRPLPSRNELHQWDWPKRVWSRVHVDYAGPINGRYVLVVVDATSKWVEAVVTTSMTSPVTVDVLRLIFSRFGLPDTIVSDNGPAFVGEEFRRFTRANGIRHVTTAPYKPASNGLAERYVKEVKYALRRVTGGNMTVRLAKWLMSHHSTPNATTGVTPASLMFGRELKTRLQLLKPNLESTVDRQKDRQRASYDTHTKRSHFQVSDRVFARGYMAGPTWLPGVVVSLLGSTMAEVLLDDGRLWRRHFDQLRTGGGAAPVVPGEPDLPCLDQHSEGPELTDDGPEGRHLAGSGPVGSPVVEGQRRAAEPDVTRPTVIGREVEPARVSGPETGDGACAGDGVTKLDESLMVFEPDVTERGTGSPKAHERASLRRSQRTRRQPDFYRPGAVK